MKTAIVNLDTIVTGDWREPLAEGDSILMEDGLIAEVGTVEASKVKACDVVLDAGGMTAMPGMIDSQVHNTFGDYTPRQKTVGFLESYLHGGTTTSITACEVHVPGRPSDPEGVKALAIAAKKCFDNYRPGGMRVHAGAVILEPGLTAEDFDEMADKGIWLAKGGVRKVPVALRVHPLCEDGAGLGHDRQLPHRRRVDSGFVRDHRQAPDGHAPRRLVSRQRRAGGDAGRGFRADRQRDRDRAADLPGRQYSDRAALPQPRGRGRPVRPLPDRHRHADRHRRDAARHDQVGLRAVLPLRLSGGDDHRGCDRQRRQGLPARHRLPEAGAGGRRSGARQPARLLQGRRAGLDQERRLPGDRGLFHLRRIPRFIGKSRNTPPPTRKTSIAKNNQPNLFSPAAHV